MERHIKGDEIYCNKTLNIFYHSRLDTPDYYKFFLHDLDVNKILASKKESYGTKIFT